MLPDCHKTIVSFQNSNPSCHEKRLGSSESTGCCAIRPRPNVAYLSYPFMICNAHWFQKLGSARTAKTIQLNLHWVWVLLQHWVQLRILSTERRSYTNQSARNMSRDPSTSRPRFFTPHLRNVVASTAQHLVMLRRLHLPDRDP